ncbi:hypothetical protein EXIGLDRAFT_361476 [Exidia glandulosa HHB12029]|uniref:Uncharacterized protein n=1 Tax=Exidia glandulosa HHB12029 TaxID=1314781 RepID=A0A165L8K3_EXIGL|nr:hypothetical protein EXIGLDRAFT_361476 [Exidia glandulosa HHB12029]
MEESSIPAYEHFPTDMDIPFGTIDNGTFMSMCCRSKDHNTTWTWAMSRRSPLSSSPLTFDYDSTLAQHCPSPNLQTCRNYSAMTTVDSIEACAVKKEEDLELPSLSYLQVDLAGSSDAFSRVRHQRFSGNEDGKLLDHGIRFHLLLATLQEYEELTKVETQEFQDLSDAIRERANRLPLASGGALAGRDNFGREYVVVGRYVWTYSMVIEKREYSDGIGEEIWFSLLRDNYFYFKPDGGLYGHYVLKDGSLKAIKLSRNQIKRYSYPPDTYMSQKGFQAERFY